MSKSTLIKWAEENERMAADYRVIALTDPARYKPAMQAARAHDSAARKYRAAANIPIDAHPISG